MSTESQIAIEDLREIRRALENLSTSVCGLLRNPTDRVAISYAKASLESSIEATRIVERRLP